MSHDYQVLFTNEVTYSKLASLLSQNAKIKQTNLSDSFSYQDYLEQYGKRATPLFAVNAKRQLRFFTREEDFAPDAAWIITSLIQEEPERNSEWAHQRVINEHTTTAIFIVSRTGISARC